MKILINDLIQFSDISDELKSPSLSSRVENNGLISVTFTIPNDYSTFEVYSGILSQPLYNTISGVLSQPISPIPSISNLVDDIGNQLVDDIGNDYINLDFLDSSENYSGTLSQPIYSVGSNEFDCIGIGGTDATEIIINGDIVVSSGNSSAFENGLYEIGQTVTASTITIEHNGSYLGRIAVGKCMCIPISPSREPGFGASVQPRRSLSGDVIPTAGGYSYRQIGVDTRYKIEEEIYEEFRRAYATQTALGYPFFLDFNNEKWLPYQKFYGEIDNNLVFQSSINRFSYSKRFDFTEAF